MVYIPALYRPAARGRTWRSDAPPSVPVLRMLRPTTLDGMAPIGSSRPVPLAPEECISLQDVPAIGFVALVARNPDTGRMVLRIECEDDERIVRWLSKAARHVLAVFYRVRSARIKLMGS